MSFPSKARRPSESSIREFSSYQCRRRCDLYGDALTKIVLRAREATQASLLLLTSNMMPTRRNENVPIQYRDLEERFIDLQNSGVLAAYAQRVREIREKYDVAVADVYAAWEKLSARGVDTTAMLVNGLNHPDATGHRIAAECLLELLAPKA